MAAGALPLMFVACTNELENVAVEDQQQAPQEIVGAQLVSKGMTINVNRGTGVNSRLDKDGNFVDGDKVGLAWYKANGVSTIYDVQLDPLTHDWTTYMGKAPSDNKIFGNHKFTKDGGDFSTDANVYEGFHFAYYPYAYEKQVGKKIVTPNANPQKGTSAEELWNEAFYISAQDSLLATSANEDGTISKTFNLARVVWGLHFDLTPGEDILAMEYLKDFQIRNVQIQTGGNAWNAEFFNPTAQIIPGNLPYALYDAETGEYKAEETEAQLYNMNLYGEYSAENDNNLAFAFTEKAGMMTTVVENPAIQLNAYNEVRMLLFPTDNYASLIPADELAVEINVDCGKFRFYCEDEESNNGKQLRKLREFLSIGINNGTGPKASELQNANVGFDFDLTGADFIPDFSSITDITEWENAVKLVKDLKLKNPKFTVDGNVEFANSIPMPEDGVEVETANAGQLNVIGNVVLPEDLLMDATDKFVVSEGAVLTVSDEVKLTANVINNGVIKAGKKSLISKVENSLGRIEVVYGSYVEVEAGKDGTIAYEVLAATKETPKRINTMINGGDNGRYALVNTLVINKGVTFDLMMSTTSSSEEDPYYEVTSETNKVTNLKDIKIEMNGGTILGEQEISKSVKDVEVKSGTTNVIRNINIVGDLNVAKVAKVTIDATAHDHGLSTVKHDVIVGNNIVNEGTINATVEVRTKNVDNEVGKIVVNTGYTMWYSNTYIQGGVANGKILKSTSGVEIVTVEYDNSGDDVKNGTSLINAVKNAAAGSIVYVPAGNYEFNGTNLAEGPLVIDKSISIIGENGTKIKGHYNYGWLTATRVFQIYCDDAEKIVLENLEMLGTDSDGFTGANIYIRNKDEGGSFAKTDVVLKNVNCKDVRIENSYMGGKTINGTLENCKIVDFTIGGWIVDGVPSYATLTYDGSNTINSLIVDDSSVPELSTINGVTASKVGLQ